MRTRLPRTLAPLLMAAIAALMLTSCGQATADEAEPEAASPQHTEYPLPRPATPPPSGSAVQDSLNGYAERVQALGARPEHTGAFAGVETDIPGNRLLVHRRPSEAFDVAVRMVVPAERLWLRDVPYSAVDLEAGLTRVRADVAYWKRRGVEINTMGTHAGLGCVEIGVSEPDRHGAALAERYGANMAVCVVLALPPVPGKPS